MTESRLWILGAEDPEMSAIEKLLTDCGEKVAYAIASDGNRVHAGNAYKAVSRRRDELHEYDTVVCVECSLDCERDHDPLILAHVDHHRPCDPGYGKPPAEFLSASSIGQVCRLIMHPDYIDNILAAIERGDNLVDSDQAIVFTAAADHCLGAAYQGQCPGVDPDALMAWRVSTRATLMSRTEQEILNDIRFSCDMLRGAPSEEGTTWSPNRIRDMRPGWDKCLECKHPTCHHSFDVKHNAHMCLLCASCSLEHHDIFPELPEAACREGVAYVATVEDRDGRKKDVLGGCTTPEQVTNWITARSAEGRETYGDPARGFAGAYHEGATR